MTKYDLKKILPSLDILKSTWVDCIKEWYMFIISSLHHKFVLLWVLEALITSLSFKEPDQICFE